MTPLQIIVLIHYHAIPRQHPECDSCGIQGAIDYLLNEGVIKRVDDGLEEYHCRYTTTELGAAWLRAICAIPKPELVYVDKDGHIL